LTSETDGVNTAEKYFVANRLAYNYTEKDYTYGYHSYDDDRFGGFDYQTTFSGGYGRNIIDTDDVEWDAEIGPGYRISKTADDQTGEDSEELVLRLFTNYVWDFSENSTFSQRLNVEAGEDNTVSNSRTALEVKVIGEVSIILSYTIKYTETVPADTKHADTESAVTVSYSF
jgi:putative salt-induced outer membrane protein YdiY